MKLTPDDTGGAKLEAGKCADIDLHVTVDGVGTKVIPVTLKPGVFPITSARPGKKSLKVRVWDQKELGITGYQIKYRVKGTKKWKKKNFGPNKSTFTLKGLKKGKRYVVSARAFYKSQKDRTLYGPWSTVVKSSGKVK